MKPKFRNIFFKRAKSRALCQATASLLSGFVLFSASPVVWALPSNGTVVAGDAVINQGVNNMTINQITSKAIIDWQKFGITSSEALRFLQPDKSSVILNRVTGKEASNIFGELTANGRVFIVNPNGILFGAGASIDVAGLMATTLNIKNEDFMAGNYTFSQDDAKKLAYVVNEGRITIGDNGFAYLVAPGVENKGVIVAKAGQVVMASGKQAYVDFSGDGLVKFKVSGKITEKIIGPDGKPMASSVSNSGSIQAQGGQVLLSGDTAREVVTSVVNNTGVIEASSFGDITGSVRMEARKGGDVLNNGKISVSAKNKGEKAGKVVLSAENVGQFGTISADSKEGQAGTIDLRASNVVALSNDSVTTANAVDRGNGGTILVIGENSARVGTGAVLQARGGAFGGDGGFIETSGHKSFEIGSIVDVSAAAGKAGTWLIDPANLTIVSGNTETNIDKDNGVFTSNDDGANLGVNLILDALRTGNVIIRTGTNGTQEGNITVNAQIAYNGLTGKTLTLDAHNNIIINSNISATGSGGLSLDLQAGGGVSLAGGVSISTNGGSFTSQGISFTMGSGSSITTNGGNFTSQGGNFSMVGTSFITTSGGNFTSQGGNFSMAGTSSISTNGGSFTSKGGNFSMAGTSSISTNGGSFTSEGGSFSMAAGNTIDTQNGAITIKNTGSVSLGNLTSKGNINVTQADGILVEGTVSSIGTIGLTAKTGSITTSLNGLIIANILNLVTEGTENASIGKVSYGVGGGGATTVTTTGLNIKVNTLNASTKSGISGKVSTGNIIIENIGDTDLTLGKITTNGDKGDTDIATVIINSKGSAILGSGTGTHVDAFSASFAAKNDITLNTALSVLRAETLVSGNITINNTSDSLFILGAIAREYGNTAMVYNGDVKAMTEGKVDGDQYIPGAYVDGTKNISITSSGEIGLQGTISATNKVSLESQDGSIINATDGSNLSTITSNRLSLKAKGAVGAVGSGLKTLTGYRIDVSAGTVWATVNGVRKEIGGIYLDEVNRLNIGTIIATGSQGNVGLTATTGNAFFAHTDSKITAKEGSVTISAIAGQILSYILNTGDVIEAKVANLTAKSIGTDLEAIKTKTEALNLVSRDGDNGFINVKNSIALSSITVETPGAPVNISSTGAILKFGKDEKLSITNGTGTSLNFSNTLGGIKFDSIDLGSKDLILKAAKAITQSSGLLIAGNATITAGENIGTSSASLRTKVSSLNLSSSKNGIYVEQESSGVLKLNAVASGESSDIKIIQTGSGDMEIKKVTSSKGGVTLKSSGSILNDNTILGDLNIKGNSLQLTANGSIGTDAKAIITSISKTGSSADFTANAANGGIFIDNSGSIKLNASTSNTGDIHFSNTGDIALDVLNAGEDKNLILKVKGALTDANGDALNITAQNADLRADSLASSSDKLEIYLKKLDVTATNGALYLKQIGNNDFYLDTATSAGTASIEAGGTIYLGFINAPGQSVILKSVTGDILDNRPIGSGKPNVNAKSLDISARDLGTESKRLSLSVSNLSSSSSGDVFAENIGSLHVTADSLTGKGSGQKVSIIASDITVFDNTGGTTTLDNNGSLELIAKNGNIIFLNTNDTIVVTGTGSIYLEALGTVRPSGESGLVGLIVAGNLITAGGDITLKASSHISINLLNAGATGNVTVQSNNGLIVDNNGDKVNIIAKNVVLSGKTLSDTQLDDDKKTAIADVGDKILNKNLQEQLWSYAKNDVATYEGLVAQFNQLYKQALSNVDATEAELDSAQTKADAAYIAFQVATGILDAASLVSSILEIPAGAAQAIPLTGDGGSALALGIANSILAGLQLGVNQAQIAADNAADNASDLAVKLGDLKNDLYTNKQLLDNNDAYLSNANVRLSDLTEKVDKATIGLAASKIIESLTAQAANNNNVIGSSSQALGIQAERVDATAFGQSNVYIESSSTLGVGDITAHGKDTVVEVTAKDGISLLGTTTSTKNIVLYSENGAITAAAGAKLDSDDLVAVAKNGIGTSASAVNTTVKRIAATTEKGGAYFVNTSGNEALSIDEISVSTSNLTKTVTGVTAKDDVLVETSGDLVLNKAVRNTSKAGTVTLTATGGSITGTADNPPAYHVEGGTLLATAAKGIGIGEVALRTDIAKLTAAVTGDGLVNIAEKDAIELTSVTTANGSISVNAGGNIDAKVVVSTTDAEGNVITLNTSNGDIVAGTITAGKTHGDITLSALGGRVNNDANTATLITGHNLAIAAKSGIGAVGTNANISLDTSVARLEATTRTGVINISESDDLDVKNVNTGDGDITIVNAAGDLNITQIVASGSGNTVTLDAKGKIVSAIAPEDKNGAIIIATNLAATAGTGIGSAANFIEIEVNNLEAKTTSGGIYVNDLSGDLIVGGVTPNLGRPALNGLEAGAGSIVITTTGAMYVNETVTATDGDILLSANGGDLSTSAAITATTGDVTMDAFGNIITAGLVTAGNDILLTAKDGEILTNAAVTATTGNVEMTAGLGIEIKGAVTAGTDVLLTAKSGDIVTKSPGTITATLGNVTMDASGNVTIGATVTAEKNVLVTAKDGDILTNATVTATTGNMEMTAGLGIEINGAVTAGTDVLLTAKSGDLLTTAAVTANLGDVTMDARGNITIGGTVTADDNVKMTAGKNLEINGDVIASKENVLLTAIDGNITTTTSITATLGNVTMDAWGNITIGGTVTADDNVKMTAGKSIDINGAVTAYKENVLLTAIDGDITTTASVTATLGNVEMTAGNIGFGSSGNITIGGTVTAGTDVLLKVKDGDIKTTAAIQAGNNVEMTAGGLFFGSSGNITIGDTVTATRGLVKMTAGNDIGINGAVRAGTDVLLVAQNGDIKTTSTVNADTGNVEMNAGDVSRGTSGNITIGDTVTAGTNVLLTAIDGLILTNGAVTATTGNVEMTAGLSIEINGAVTADKNVSMTAGQGIQINDAITASKENVVLIAKGGDIVTTAPGTITATLGDVSMDASGNVTIGATVTADKNVSMTAGQGIQINDAVTASNENVVLTAKGGDIVTTAPGTITATLGDVTMDASGNITVGATVTADKNVSMTAGQGIQINDAVTASNENVVLIAEDGDIVTTAPGTILATLGDVIMEAWGNIKIGSTVTAGNDVVVTAKGGNILTTAAIEATQGYVNIDASGNVTMGGSSVTAGSNVIVTARDGDIITTAAVEAGNNIDMIASKGIEINGTVTARDSNISMVASGNDINLNQTVSAVNGDVTLEATKGSILGTSAKPPLYHVVAKTLKATAAKGIGSSLVALRTNIAKFVGVLTGKGNIVISQKGELEADIITEDGAITVTAGGTINATNVVSKTDSDNNDITLTSKDGDILVGNIEAGQGKEADVILNAENGVLQAIRPDGKPIVADELIGLAQSGIDLDTSVNSADLTVTNDGDINIKETDDLVLQNTEIQGDGSISVSADGKLEGVHVVANNGDINLNSKGDLIAGYVVSTTDAVGNDINLISKEGDIIVDYVAAGRGSGGNVILKAQAGEIRESAPKDSSVDIVGREVSLYAKGNIGVGEAGGLDIDSEIIKAYSTEGNISLADMDDIVIYELHAKKGTVKVTAGGLISDDNNNDTKIIAKDLILESVAGIGVRGASSTQALDTEVGTLTASVSGLGGINIAQKGNLDVKKVVTANGNIILVVDGNMGVDFIAAKGTANILDLKVFGAITDINDTATDKNLNIAADEVKLDGSKGVGTKDNPLEISTSEISAKGGTGGLYITNIREGLIINDYVTDEGDIVLTTAGELVINDAVKNLGGGDISLTITDTGRDNDNIVINAEISTVGDGSIYLNADDSVYQNANMTVENKSNVHVIAGDSIYMANGASTIAHLGNIVYKAGNEIELGKLIVTKNPYYGTVTVEAPKIRNNNATGEAAIQAGYIFVNTNVHETKDLVFGLIGKDESYGIWLNDRLVGGLVSRDATFISEPRLESELKDFGRNLFRMNSKYRILPMEPVNYTDKGFIYDEKSKTWEYKR